MSSSDLSLFEILYFQRCYYGMERFYGRIYAHTKVKLMKHENKKRRKKEEKEK